MGESNDTLTISDYWKAQGYDTVVPVKTTDHPFMFKGDVDISPDHRLSGSRVDFQALLASDERGPCRWHNRAPRGGCMGSPHPSSATSA